MKYWIDTEFIEDGRTIDIISIGIVAEDGREFYAENLDCDYAKANDWVKENVIPHLWSRQQSKAEYNAWTRDGGRGGLVNRKTIATDVSIFCDPDQYGKPEFWGYYADYDWVVFCQLFGRMIDLPKGFPMYCNDIKQLAVSLGNPKLPEQSTTEHHALADARWNREAYEFLAAHSSITEGRVRAVVAKLRESSGVLHYNGFDYPGETFAVAIEEALRDAEDGTVGE